MPFVYWITCLCCGKVFEASRSDAKWCNATCRKRAHRKNKGTKMHEWNKRQWFKPEFSKQRPMAERKSRRQT